MGAAGCCGFGLPPPDDGAHAHASTRQDERSRRRAANAAALSHIELLVPWLEARNQTHDEISAPEREQHRAQLATITSVRQAILAQPVAEQDKEMLLLCDESETDRHAALALLDHEQQRRKRALQVLRDALVKHRAQPSISAIIDLILPCISWCVDVIVDSKLRRRSPALVHRAQEWVREANPMLDDVMMVCGPLSQHQRVAETCLRVGCYHLVDHLLRRFGGTCDYRTRPSQGSKMLSERSWLWLMAKCNFIHVADFTPIFALMSAHGLDPALIPTEPNPVSALQIAREVEKQVRADAVVSDAAGMPDPEAVSPLLAALAPAVPASAVPASASSSSSSAEAASSSSDAAAPHFENCLLRYTTYTALPSVEEEDARCSHMRTQFLLALLRAWRTHSAAVHVLLLDAAPTKLIPDLVAIVAEYLDLSLAEEAGQASRHELSGSQQ